MSAYESFVCPECGRALAVFGERLTCECTYEARIEDGIPRFVKSNKHENFGLQWNRFSRVQLDSCNGTHESRDRLLDQSGLSADFFRGKSVLEVGCGAGRFTEILLGFGARVMSVDYSSAVDANARSNKGAQESGVLRLAQADIFRLPFRPDSFDIVLCYGVIQHTGDNRKAICSLWRYVRPGGLLLIDCYRLGFRHTMPIKYLLRPLLKRLPVATTLRLAERTCRLLVPLQIKTLRYLRAHRNIFSRCVCLLVNRSPNSVYPVNLYLQGKIDVATCFDWSVLDTFDQWGPVYDRPMTARGWEKLVVTFAGKHGGEVQRIGESGQGNIAVLRKACEDGTPAATGESNA